MVSQLQTISTISRSVTKGPHISLAGSTKQQGPPMTGRTDKAQKGGQFNKPLNLYKFIIKHYIYNCLHL